MKHIFYIFCSLLIVNSYADGFQLRDSYECRTTCGIPEGDDVEEFVCNSENSLEEAKECSKSLCAGKKDSFQAFCVVEIDGEVYETTVDISPIIYDVVSEDKLEIENPFDFTDGPVFGTEGIIDEDYDDNL